MITARSYNLGTICETLRLHFIEAAAMNCRTLIAPFTVLLIALAANPASAQSAQPAGAATYDYFAANRELIRSGVQAVLMCNGLFTSGRNLEQVFTQELAYMERVGGTIGTAGGGDWNVDQDRRMVTVGQPGSRISAVFRAGTRSGARGH